MRRAWPRTLAVLTLVGVLLVTPPMVLIWVGWPLRGVEMPPGYVWAALRSLSLPPPLLAALLVGAVWVAWGVFVVLVGADVVALARGRLPRLGPLRLLAATLVTSSLTTPPALAADTPPPAHSHHSIVETHHEGQSEGQSQQEPKNTVRVQERTRIVAGFELASAELTPQMQESLQVTVDVVQLLAASGPTEITVSGHTDSSGSVEYNQQLSQERAQTVADYLHQRLGEGVTIHTEGLADAQPRADGEEIGPEGERRVEITYTLPSDLAPPRGQEEDSSPASTPDTELTTAQEPSSETEEGPVVVELPPGGVLAATAALGVGVGWVLGARRRIPSSPRESTLLADPTDEEGEGSPPPRQRGWRWRRVSEEPPPIDSPPPTEPTTPPNTDAETIERGHRTAAGVIDPAGSILLAHTLTEEPVRIHALTGLALTGEQAMPIAAALLAAAALEGTRVITTAEVATAVGYPTPSPMPTVQVAPTLEAALLEAEALLLAAARHHETHPDLEDTSQEADEHAPWGLLLTHAPSHLGERLVGVAARGAQARLLVVAVGEWEAGSKVGCDHPDELTVRLSEQTDAQRLTDVRVCAAAPTDLVALWPAPATPLQTPVSTPTPDEKEAKPSPLVMEESESSLPPSPPAEAEEPDTSSSPPPQPATETKVHLRLFGATAAILTANGEVTTGLRSVARTLLVLLVLRRTGVSGEEISEMLSPDPTRARVQRNAAVSNLRSAVREATGIPDLSVVTHHAGRYQLDPDLFEEVDVWRFDEQMQAARRSHGAQRRTHLKNALDLYTGPLLSGMDDTWVEAEREQRRRAAASAAVELAHAAEGAQDALEWLEIARSADETNEALYQEIMRTQARRGRPDAIERTFEVLCERLDGIDAAPSAATTALFTELTSLPPPKKKRMRRKPRHTRR